MQLCTDSYTMIDLHFVEYIHACMYYNGLHNRTVYGMYLGCYERNELCCLIITNNVICFDVIYGYNWTLHCD